MKVRTTAVLACLLLLTAAAGGAVSLASAQTVHTIDANHELASEAAITEYQETGAVTAENAGGYDLNVTVADGHEDVNLSGLHSDVGTFLRVDYDESISRTVRIYVPSEYFYPFVKEDLEAENAAVTADLSPTEDFKYTAVTVRLNGKTDATFKLNAAASGIFHVREAAHSQWENTTGIELPSVMSGQTQWQRLPSDALTGNNTTAALDAPPDDIMLQYDTSNSPTERWVTVPECSGGQQLCWFTREDSNRTHLLSRTSDSPAVRYKRGSDLVASVRADINDIRNIPNDIEGIISSWTSGGWF